MRISLVRVLTLEELPFEDAMKIACGEVKYFTTLFHTCELTRVEFSMLSYNLEAMLKKFANRELIIARNLELVLQKELAGTNFPGMPVSLLGSKIGNLYSKCMAYPEAVVQVEYESSRAN